MGVTVLESGGRASAREPTQRASAAQAAQKASARSSETFARDYAALLSKPSIEHVELVEDRSLDEFGMGLAPYQNIMDLFG